jgi:CRISPR-associated protein Csx14
MSFSVNVDPTNPGQFFACCGLLELADRLWPGAEGWFADGQFHVTCGGDMPALLGALATASFTQIEKLENGLVVRPIISPLRLSFNGGAWHFTLDGWMTVGIARAGPEKGNVTALANPPWNFWSGQQTPLRIWEPVRDAIAGLLPHLKKTQLVDLFDQRQFLTGRFGFDPGPAWNALDVGFSPNEQGIAVESSPAVELLAAVGLQRFRPRMGDTRDWFIYATWGVPLPPGVACAAACAVVRFDPSVCYCGRVVSRGQYAALAYSTLLSGAFDE